MTKRSRYCVVCNTLKPRDFFTAGRVCDKCIDMIFTPTRYKVPGEELEDSDRERIQLELDF